MNDFNEAERAKRINAKLKELKLHNDLHDRFIDGILKRVREDYEFEGSRIFALQRLREKVDDEIENLTRGGRQ